jgi:hypothetical protein
MSTVVHERQLRLVGDDGEEYAVARVHAEPRRDGTWDGWIEFATPAGLRVVTDRETTQSSREAVAYWASGLEGVYLEGALQRALAALAVS